MSDNPLQPALVAWLALDAVTAALHILTTERGVAK
jgi:hypothetical protein